MNKNEIELLVRAAKAYYIDNIPTGMLDSEFDLLERRCLEENNISVRDYVFNEYLPKGERFKNSYIGKIKKLESSGVMANDLTSNQNAKYALLKYDGSSLAIYLDPTTGKPLRVVTVGNLNVENFGIDQSWKLLKFLPDRFPKGIVAIQAEGLIELGLLRSIGEDVNLARQKANGLVNSTKEEHQERVNSLLTIRAYRYFTENNISIGDYKDVLSSFPTKADETGRILFAPADVLSVDSIRGVDPTLFETKSTPTSTGEFLNDGWVIYDSIGNCINAFKFTGAGEGTETPVTTVLGIQWNHQLKKGKDTWSANVLIEPVNLRSSVIRKPSAGSVGKLLRDGISVGAKVEVIMSKTTIPKINRCISPGNGDFNWPTCECGYKMSGYDIFGSTLRCQESMCSSRISRMNSVYLQKKKDLCLPEDLNAMLVIDRFDWATTGIDMGLLKVFILKKDKEAVMGYLSGFLTTELQKSILSNVFESFWYVINNNSDKND